MSLPIIKIKKAFCLLLFSNLFFLINISAQPSGFSYYKVISIDSAKVIGSSDYSNFPLLFSTVSADLRTQANGGHVKQIGGGDIIFTLSDDTTALEHEIESYNPVTGAITAWIKIPVLFTDSITTLHMYYGNPCYLGNSNDVWTGEYEAVLHLQQDPSGSSPQMTDSSPNGNSGITQGSMLTGNSVAGKMGNGLSFDEANDAVSIPDFDYTASNAFSISFWFNVADNTGTSYQYMFSHGNYGVANSLNIYFGEASLGITADQGMLKTVFQDSNDATNPDTLDAGNTFADGNWHYYVFTVSSSGNPRIYIDGVHIVNFSIQGGNSYNPTTNIFLGSRSDLNATRFYGGILDEFRIRNTNVSANAIATEYNNQSSPGTFYDIGSENSTGNSCNPLPVELTKFEAYVFETTKIKLEWETASEIFNDYFEIQKSTDGINWEVKDTVDGMGYSTQTVNYTRIDPNPSTGTSYYRLKQIDFNGSFSFSEIRSVNFEGVEIISSSPNPATEYTNIIINSSEETTVSIQLFESTGKIVFNNQLKLNKGFTQYTIYTKLFRNGAYILRVETGDGQYHDVTRIQIE